ncbi:MAG: NTP transferase domain-containing protein [Candidatus Omnitrophica bacterium]|nr:NTP transferase domain-containing protein [Candidatus Omnitrophota bacterium]
MNEKLKKFLIPGSFRIKDAMRFMSTNGQKEIFIVNGNNQLLGSLSDGDIRKWILKGGGLQTKAGQICNKKPKVIGEDFAIETVKSMMLEFKIDAIPQINGKRQVQNVLVWGDVFADKISRPKEKLHIPVVIMAGGKGTRLDPFTKILPKPLIPVGDKPVIEWIMERFFEYGMNHFYVSINHKARMIRSYFQEAQIPCRVDFLQENIPLGTAGSLKMLSVNRAKKFLVTNSDVIINSDYAELVRFHDEHRYDLTLVVSCRHYVIPYGVCDIIQGGELKQIREKPEYDLLVNTGMYVINRNLFKLIPKNKAFDITDLIAKVKGQGFRVGTFPINEQSWIDVGQWEEYHKALKMFGA